MFRLVLIAFDASEISHAAGFAQDLGMPFDVLCLKGQPELDLGAEKILLAGLSDIPPASGLAEALKDVVSSYSHIAAISNMQSKDVLARLAGLIDGAMVTDTIETISPSTYKRPIVAGSIIATVETLSIPVVITFRAAGYGTPQRRGQSSTEVISLSIQSSVKRIAVTARGGSRPDLTQARVVVSGGRPLKDSETYENLIGGLADKLGGAAGATRAAVDNGIAPNELQVGQTGKIVAPELYIAAGISGSTQHMAGIKDSKIIVAINKDPDAPIFEFADFGLVADLYDAIPEITSKL